MKIAVIGSGGKMGRYHRKALEKEHTIITCDTKYGHQYKDIDIDNVDKVIIATPTVTHYGIGYYFLKNKIDTFIEKPICSTYHSAKVLLDTKDSSTQLMVGHIENYNPVIKPLYKLLSESPPVLMTTTRNGFALRVTEYNPVMDLMIHDVGIAIELIDCNAKVIHIEKNGYRAEALVEYNGIPVVHKVNMLSNITERKLLITREDGFLIEVDLLGKKINNYVYPGDALRAELSAFLSGCRNGSLAADALKICEEIVWKKE